MPSISLPTLRTGYQMALLCEAVYKNSSDIDNLSEHLGFTGFRNVSTRDTECFLVWNDKRLVLALRGTDSHINWLGNLRVRKVPFGYGYVHRGFLKEANGVWGQIVHAIADEGINLNQRQVFCCGHSLGGALATLIAERIRTKYSVSSEIWAFGAPPVGDAAFFRPQTLQQAACVFQVASSGDLVPHSLPKFLGHRGYCRTPGMLLWFGADGVLKLNPRRKVQFKGFAVSLWRHLWKRGLMISEHHKMSRYAELMKGELKYAEATSPTTKRF